MKTRKLIGRLVVTLSLALPALAQTTIKEALANHWKASEDLTLKVADAMPADSYGFRPVPEEMSYGELMVHISLANSSACAAASGMKAPAVPAAVTASRTDPKALDKATAIKYMKDTFEFCNAAVASMTPQKLDAMVGPEGHQSTAFERFWAYFTHTAHHRGQAEVYLRLKGVVPPTYTF
jgi:uncharacterized damage-inducible protein DinB